VDVVADVSGAYTASIVRVEASLLNIHACIGAQRSAVKQSVTANACHNGRILKQVLLKKSQHLPRLRLELPETGARGLHTCIRFADLRFWGVSEQQLASMFRGVDEVKKTARSRTHLDWLRELKPNIAYTMLVCLCAIEGVVEVVRSG
jgi:hypothetical protein